MNIVMVCSSPEWQEMVQAPWELVAAVRVDGLEQSEYDPDVHSEDVQVFRDGAPEDGNADSTKGEDHRFDRGSIFSGEAERGRILVVEFVNLLV